MKDETLQKLIKLLYDGFFRELLGIAFKATRLGSIEKTKSIGGSKETWNQKCHKAQKDTTHQRNCL